MSEVLFKIAAFNLCEKRSIFSSLIVKNSKSLRLNQAKCKGVNEFIYSFFSIRINQCDFCLSLIDKALKTPLEIKSMKLKLATMPTIYQN